MIELFRTFDLAVIAENTPLLLAGMWVTIQLTVVAICGGLLLGTFLAIARLSPVRLVSFPATVYVNLVRSIPLILVIFWIYIVAPVVLGRPVDAFRSVLFAFVLFEAAYFCEIIRGGISGVKRSQVSAGLALGLSKAQVMRYVVMPQAFRHMIPVLLTQSIIMFQHTSLAYVVGLRDFLTTGEIVANNTNRPVEIFIMIGIVYFAICFTASQLVSRLARALRT